MKPRFAYVLPTRSFAGTRALAERAEAAGWDTVAVEDHFFMRTVLTAKIATTLDHVGGGRLELGLGAGWFREESFGRLMTSSA